MKTYVLFFNNNIVLYHRTVFTSILEFKDGSTMLACEMAPSNELEKFIIGEF